MEVYKLSTKVKTLLEVQKEIIRFETRYSTLSELWDSKSKAIIHLDISNKMDEALVKLEGLRSLEKQLKVDIEKLLK